MTALSSGFTVCLLIKLQTAETSSLRGLLVFGASTGLKPSGGDDGAAQKEEGGGQEEERSSGCAEPLGGAAGGAGGRSHGG